MWSSWLPGKGVGWTRMALGSDGFRAHHSEMAFCGSYVILLVFSSRYLVLGRKMAEDEATMDVEETPVEEETEIDQQQALRVVLRNALVNDGLRRGLHE